MTSDEQLARELAEQLCNLWNEWPDSDAGDKASIKQAVALLLPLIRDQARWQEKAGYESSCISHCLRGKRQTHGGKRWERTGAGS